MLRDWHRALQLAHPTAQGRGLDAHLPKATQNLRAQQVELLGPHRGTDLDPEHPISDLFWFAVLGDAGPQEAFPRELVDGATAGGQGCLLGVLEQRGQRGGSPTPFLLLPDALRRVSTPRVGTRHTHRSGRPFRGHRGAEGGNRTHKPLRTTDFESVASASSATSAFCATPTAKPKVR